MSTPDWPPYVFRALSAMHLDGPPEPEAEAYLDAFIATWGGLDVEALHRALGAGDESHRLFALCALGASGAERARAALLPFLTSDRLPERWASALALGNVREERALPVLYRMLAEALPPDETFRRCWDWRFAVPDIRGPGDGRRARLRCGRLCKRPSGSRGGMTSRVGITARRIGPATRTPSSMLLGNSALSAR